MAMVKDSGRAAGGAAKKKKKKRKGSVTSSSSSPSSDEREAMVWMAPGEKRVKYGDGHRLQVHLLRLRRRSDLLRVAARRPGLLAGHFLAQ
eukprot:6668142-Lingulodinium_polyedra.AAC.1